MKTMIKLLTLVLAVAFLAGCASTKKGCNCATPAPAAPAAAAVAAPAVPVVEEVVEEEVVEEEVPAKVNKYTNK
jgi:uncharacterized lipoprotein YajG